MSSWKGLNRRNFPRVVYPCQIIIRDKEDNKIAILTHTENVGCGGACVILRQNLKLFSPVEVELDLLDMENHVKCHGKIVWNFRRKEIEETKPLFYDAGVEFSDITENDKKRIERVVQSDVKRKSKGKISSW